MRRRSMFYLHDYENRRFDRDNEDDEDDEEGELDEVETDEKRSK